MTKLIIALLFLLALIIPILSNAVTTQVPADAGQTKGAATCQCADCAKNCKDCCCKVGKDCSCARSPQNADGKAAVNCAKCSSKDCPKKKDCNLAVDCANCPNKECPKRVPAKSPDCCSKKGN